LERRADPFRVRARVLDDIDRSTGEDVLDLSHAVDASVVSAEEIEEVRLGRRKAVAPAIRRALDLSLPASDERSRDHAADSDSLGELARGSTDLVEPFEAESGLGGGDLKHAVRRCVDDRLAGAQVLLAQIIEDLGSRGGPVAQVARQVILGAPHAKKRLRESLRKDRKGLVEDDARDLPIAGHPVLPGGDLLQDAEGRDRRGGWREAVGLDEMTQTPARELGKRERNALRSAPLADVAERVRAFVAETSGVERAADPDRVEDDQNRSIES